MDRFDSSHIANIKSIINQFHSEGDSFKLDKFNEEIHIFLNNLFEKSFGNEYLYSTLLFVKKDIIQKHSFLFNSKNNFDKKRNYVENIQPVFARILRIKKLTIGLSNHIVKNKINGLVLYESNIYDKKKKAKVVNKIEHSFDLDNIELNEQISNEIRKLSFNEEDKKILDKLPDSLINKIPNKLLKASTYSNLFNKNHYEESIIKLHNDLNISSSIETIKPILILYKIGNPKLHESKEFFTYFVRPDTEHKYFDGLINFSLKRPLKDNELSVLNLILYYIFSEVAIKEYKVDIKNAEWKDIIDNLAHSQNNIYTYLYEKSKTLEALFIEISNSFKEKNELTFNYLSESLEFNENLFLLEKTNRLNLAIGKFTINNSNQGLKDELKEILSPRYVELEKKICEISQILLISIKSYNFQNKRHIDLALINLQKFIQYELNKFKGILVLVSETAFFIIILEIFKNLIEYSDEVNPFFDIFIEEDNDFLKLCFLNNNLSEGYIKIINRKNKVDKVSYGLRTIFRIIESGILDNLKSDDKEWALFANKEKNQVELQIPKKYIKWKRKK